MTEIVYNQLSEIIENNVEYQILRDQFLLLTFWGNKYLIKYK